MSNAVQDAIAAALAKTSTGGTAPSAVRTVTTDSLKATSKSGIFA